MTAKPDKPLGACEMSDIMYTSNNRFFIKKNEALKEYSSERITKYCDNVKSIKARHEWKTSGTGAKFTGAYNPGNSYYNAENEVRINSVSGRDGKIFYSAAIGNLSGLYGKPLEENAVEEHIFAGNDIKINKISVFNDNCAVSIGNAVERHIAVFDLKSGHHCEITEGDVLEDYPSYSNDGSKIFFSSAGLALTEQGGIAGVGPYSICCFCTETKELTELFASDKYNYIAPKEDLNGNLLFIKYPYRSGRSYGNAFMDLVLFPVRIVKAIGGLLNYFSIVFGGESLRSDKPGLNTKAKQKSEKELFFEGNIINAEQALKENQRRGEKFPGIIPHSWELVRTDKNGNQTCIKKGVMDYTLCKNGDIVYSNGYSVIRMTSEGSEQLVGDCRLACNLNEL